MQESYKQMGMLSSMQSKDIIENLLSLAVQERASDIHMDPRENDILIRFRVDGHLLEMGTIPKTIHQEFISRLKILSSLRTDIHFLPQDGRWRASVNGSDYNIRISIMPTYYGENAVLRLLGSGVFDGVNLASLGFSPHCTSIIEHALAFKNGLILVTGPTGSGKTTTLNTLLVEKSKEPISIVTLEDPIEYEIPGIRQIHVMHAQGVDFAMGLRAVLRQDPNVIMVGEIRDSETARIAVNVALTGHLVLSTIHTNSSLETIPRLIDMGIDPYLLASTMRLIIAQRLIRNLCDECFGDACEHCHQSGYQGRSLIAEVCEIDKEMSEMIHRRVSSEELKSVATAHGFRSLYDDGLEKVEWGVTRQEEILRVLS